MRKKRATANEESRMVEPGPSDVKTYIGTGSVILDLTIAGMCDPRGRGGIPVGRITEMFGPESSGKSFISGEMCGSAISQNIEAHMIDVERSFDFTRTDIFGFSPENKLFKYYPKTAEQEEKVKLVEDLFGKYMVGAARAAKLEYGLVNRLARGMPAGKKALVIVDSIAVLSTRLEDAGKDKVGASRAKMFSTGLRQTISDISDKNIALVFDNQVRDVMADGSFGSRGDGLDSPGGWAVRHYASVRIKFSTSRIRNKETKKFTGLEIHAFVAKNKIDVPYRECSFTLDFHYGIDNIRDCAMWLKENSKGLGIGQGMYQLPGCKPIKGIENFITYVEDQELEKELFNLTRIEWKKANQVEKRKEKDRSIL